MNSKVTFFANSQDGTHCFQACLRMLLKFYLPNRDFSLRELDTISAKVQGLWTWPTAALLWLSENGFEVRNVETFNYEDFASHGGDYLLEYFGEQVGQEQINHSDLAQEVALAEEFIKKIQSEMRIPEIIDLQQSLDDGRLPCCNVNSRKLNGKPGYSGHFVIVIGYDDDNLILHNPGLPAQENQIVSNELFAQAWAYPDNKAKTFFTIKPLSELN